MDNRKYFDDAMCAFVDVQDHDRKLMIVSSGKSTLAYETIVMLADRCNMHCELGMLNCEDGEPHEHAFISSRSHPNGEGKNYARLGLDLVFDCQDERISRERLQFDLGQLLGYAMDDILQFIASDTAKACVCACCGGKAE